MANPSDQFLLKAIYRELGGGNSNIFYVHPDPCKDDPISRAYCSNGWVNHQLESSNSIHTWIQSGPPFPTKIQPAPPERRKTWPSMSWTLVVSWGILMSWACHPHSTPPTSSYTTPNRPSERYSLAAEVFRQDPSIYDRLKATRIGENPPVIPETPRMCFMGMFLGSKYRASGGVWMYRHV